MMRNSVSMQGTLISIVLTNSTREKVIQCFLYILLNLFSIITFLHIMTSVSKLNIFLKITILNVQSPTNYGFK